MNQKHYKQLHERRIRHFLIIFILLEMQEVNRNYWVHTVNLLRPKKGEFYTLYPNLRHFNKKFVSMYRMDTNKFDELLKIGVPLIMKKFTYMRSPISTEQKLVLTLRWVSLGSVYDK